MRIGFFGDSHFETRRPSSRRNEDYFGTLMDKLAQVFQICQDKECSCIIQVGDFFNSPNVSLNAIIELIFFLYNQETPLYCIYGQHDIFGHSESTLKRSPIRVLEVATAIRKILDSKGTVLSVGSGTEAVLYGASFGQSIPDPDRAIVLPSSRNILVIHDMIGDRPLFPGQDLKDPINFLREHSEYSIVFCGDYHYRFLQRWKDRVIINPGALVRKTLSKWDRELKPCVGIIDTTTLEVEFIDLQVQPTVEVFDLSLLDKREEGISSLSGFIERLESEGELLISWEEILRMVFVKESTPETVQKIIYNSISEVRHVEFG